MSDRYGAAVRLGCRLKASILSGLERVLWLTIRLLSTVCTQPVALVACATREVIMLGYREELKASLRQRDGL